MYACGCLIDHMYREKKLQLADTIDLTAKV